MKAMSAAATQEVEELPLGEACEDCEGSEHPPSPHKPFASK
jgi:hypothetical protein